MSAAATAFCLNSFASGLRPDPDMTVSQWAETYRMLVQAASAEPGQWRNERTPYLVEIMDSLSPYSGIEQIAVMKGAQGGFTEAGNNWVGSIMHKFPGPTLYVQPTVDTVKKYSQTRLTPMINSCKPLRDIITDNKSRDGSNTIMMKEFPGGVLILAGANSAAGLRSMPIRYLFMDEVDGYPMDVDGEGDPIELAIKRTTTFRNRKILKVSTPNVAGLSHIERAYLAGDRRKWWVPCPSCNQPFVMRWRFSEEDKEPGGLVWKWGHYDTVRYQCPNCLELIQEHLKTQMNSGGVWVPERTEGVEAKIRSYHWPSLYSPYGWVGSSWPELAKKWEEGHKDPTHVKVFLNLELGLPYEDKATRIAEPDSLLARCELFPAPAPDAFIVPDDVILVTIGADTQPNRIEYEVVGWGRGEESWSLAYGQIAGDTSTFDPFRMLEKVLFQNFRNETGFMVPMSAACIDANFNTQTVTAWAGPLFKKRLYAIRGAAGKRAIWPRIPGKTKYNSTPLYTLGVDAAKENIIARLSILEPGPGYNHFPDGRDQEWFVQLTSEICVVDYEKNPPQAVWKKRSPGIRNEALDCRVYAYAALNSLVTGGLRLETEADKMRDEIERKKKEIIRPVSVLSNQRRATRFRMTR